MPARASSALIAGAAGYLLRLCGVPILPLVLGLVLGRLVEANFRRSLLLTSGDPIVFVNDPLALAMLVAAFAIVAIGVFRSMPKV